MCELHVMRHFLHVSEIEITLSPYFEFLLDRKTASSIKNTTTTVGAGLGSLCVLTKCYATFSASHRNQNNVPYFWYLLDRKTASSIKNTTTTVGAGLGSLCELTKCYAPFSASHRNRNNVPYFLVIA